MDAHQGAAGVLAERVELHQPARGSGGPVPGALGERPRHEAGRGLLRPAAQPLALDAQPFLEGGIADADAVEQVAAVERDRRLRRVGGPFGEQPLERGDVHRQRRGIEANRLAIGDERIAVAAQGGAEPRQGVLEAVARVGVAAVAPQQAREPVAGVGGAGGQGEHGQQRPVLLPRQVARRAVRPNLEAAEQRHRHGRHAVLLHGSSGGHCRAFFPLGPTINSRPAELFTQRSRAVPGRITGAA